MSVLITAFGPSVRIPNNPSEFILDELKRQDLDGVQYEVLEPTFRFCSSWLKLFDDDLYDIIIHLGTSPKTENVRLELYGKNHYKDPVTHRIQAIHKNSEDIRQTKFDLPALMGRLDSTHIEVSTDAGTHVCNYIYYILLGRTRQTRTKVLFVHVPEKGDFSWKVTTVQSIIGTILPKQKFSVSPHLL